MFNATGLPFVGLYQLGIVRCALVSLLLCILLLPIHGRATELAYGQGVLWQIARDPEQPNHIFGTIHVTDPRLRDLPGPVRDAFDVADKTVFELILDTEALNTMTQAVVFPRGQHLDQYLDKKTYRRTVEVAERYGIPAVAVDTIKPWALISLFAMPPAEQARNASGHPIFDDWLQQQARDDGKEVLELETVEEQISLFADMRFDDQLALLKSGLRQADEIDKIFNTMLEAYLVGDLSEVYAMLDEYNEDFTPEVSARFKQRLLFDRNHRMVERMQPFLKNGGAFVAVGALHLPGTEGILDLLEKQGYQVTRVY